MTAPGQAPVAEAAERSHFALRRAVVDVAMGLLHAGCCLAPGTLTSRPGRARHCADRHAELDTRFRALKAPAARYPEGGTRKNPPVAGRWQEPRPGDDPPYPETEKYGELLCPSPTRTLHT